MGQPVSAAAPFASADLKKLLHRFTWKPEAARYVRHWSGRGQNTGIHFMEMDVYGCQGLDSQQGSGGSHALATAGGTCTGSFSIASDNAYALYINGEHRSNVNGGRTNVDGCNTARNQFGDPYTGCNWQSVDLHEFSGRPRDLRCHLGCGFQRFQR